MEVALLEEVCTIKEYRKTLERLIYGLYLPVLSSNNADLFALHYVFIPHINFQLDLFRQSYSHHRLRTARNQSPFQLWTRGLAQESGEDAAIQGVLGDSLVRTHLYAS